jgi:hypothetical protein
MGPNADTGVKAGDKTGKYIDAACHRYLIVSMSALYKNAHCRNLACSLNMAVVHGLVLVGVIRCDYCTLFL